MSYEVLLHPKANDFFKKVEKDLETHIKGKLRLLRTDPEIGTRLKHSEFWRLRIGDHRAIYEIDRVNGRVIVLFIGHRKDVYDDFDRLI